MSSTVAGSSKREARHLRRLDDRLAQAVAARRAEEEQALHELVHELGIFRDAIEKVRADREHHAQRRGRVVGDRVQARGEREAIGRIGDLRVELLELIDEQEQLAVVAARAAAHHVAEVTGLAAQRLDELLLLVHLVGQVRRGLDHRRDQARE